MSQPAPRDPGDGRAGGLVGAARGTARALRGTAAAARSGASVADAGIQRFRRGLRRGGAEESGLATITELCVLNAAADALVAVALAGTVFFDVPVGQARGKVALYLLITMAPFALLAPVIGPLLDRVHGRRAALGASMVVRAGLCWSLASHTHGLQLYPLALGILVTSRAFSVARTAVTPRVLPPGMTLLSANSRVSLVGALGAGVVAPLGFLLQAVAGVDWVLRLASLAFLMAVLPCTQLPRHVDSATGERTARGLARSAVGAAGGRFRGALGALPTALRAVVCLRALVGFLTLFLAFKLRTAGSGKSSLAALAAAALAGQAAGITLGNRLARRRPEALIAVGLVVATAVCLGGAFLYSQPVALLVALAATLAGALGKLGLDAVIQRDIEETVRASAFARSETALQLAWVAGGAVGLAPLTGTQGFVVAALGMVAAFVTEVRALHHSRRRAQKPVLPEVLRRRQAVAAGGGEGGSPAPTEILRPPPPAPPVPPPSPAAPLVPAQPRPALLRRSPDVPADPHVHRYPPGPDPAGTLVLPFPDEAAPGADR